MRRLLFPAVLAGVIVLLGPAGLAAQIDYRNTDDDRPTLVEDAYPIERYAFELLLPYRFERERDGSQAHLSELEMEHGAFMNAHVGVKALLAAVRSPGSAALPADTDWGLAGIRLFGLYNFFTEGPVLPAVSLRGDLGLPVGSLAGDAVRGMVKLVATRSWGRTRFHANVARGFGSETEVSSVEPLPRWLWGGAIDRTLFRQSLLLLGEVYALEPVGDEPTEINATIGARWQWRPTAVLDVGISRRLRSAVGPDVALTVGLSHTFAVPGLMPRGR
ncbi:MAG: hypothetical protein ACREOF_10215 [Gemmatimonadales bacterium]